MGPPRGYYHTFPCRPAIPALVEQWTPERGIVEHYPTHATFDCPCGRSGFHVLLPSYRKALVVICPDCQDWHSILFRGPRGPQEEIEDFHIEAQLAHERET